MTVGSVLVVGLGELGGALVRQVHAVTGVRPHVCGRPGRDGAADLRWARAVEEAGGRPAPGPAVAAEADTVLVCVPARASGEVAAALAPHLRPGSVYADLSSAPPEAKLDASAVVALAGARYADGAVLGAVAAAGAAVPVLAAGDGASALAERAPALGLTVTALDAPAGTAARVKLLRSVYLKGRDALVAEMMQAARRAGLADVVAASIQGPGEEVPFPALADRVLGSLERHAARRADELADACSMLEAAGVRPEATAGAQRRLALFADGDR